MPRFLSNAFTFIFIVAAANYMIMERLMTTTIKVSDNDTPLISQTNYGKREGTSYTCNINAAKGRVCDKLVLFLHFHKAGGTSIISYLKSYGMKYKLGKKEIQKKTKQWYKDGLLYQSMNINQLKITSQATNTSAVAQSTFWEYFYDKQQIDVVNLEYNYLLPEVNFKVDLYKFTQLRHPWSRFRSTYERELWLKCKDDTPCLENDTLEKWMINQTGVFYGNRVQLWPGILGDNYYIRMLNGIADKQGTNLTYKHLEVAKAVLDTFDTVLILEDGEDVNLKKIWGLLGDFKKMRSLPKESNNYLKENRRYNQIRRHSDEMISLFNERNQMDLELYEWALDKYKI